MAVMEVMFVVPGDEGHGGSIGDLLGQSFHSFLTLGGKPFITYQCFFSYCKCWFIFPVCGLTGTVVCETDLVVL